PGGVIVVTDQLVEVMPSEEEVMAVLAHELGHVKERHSLRHLLQDSITALMGLAIFGDVSGLTSVAVALPTVLINTGYSRDFEREADQYAFALLRATGRSPRLFASALSALENARDGDPAADAAEDDDEATVQGCPLPTDTQKESDTKTAADPAATPDKPADKPTDTPTAAASHDGKPQGPPSTRKPREPVGLGYFSTHPDTAERIRAALQAAQ
ncbi:MAG: M48 family metallopeptidase, partial [Betaproteobacteria bacterium]|nr:M48 family metallopeptidase [Betaproteobacteria bacterium]